MASLLKNQILKHLSKFAKNLSPDKLHVSTLKGHGELHNLELNEKILTELLELPAWLRLTRATCNHVTLKIYWTKLKSVPIFLSLDEVIIEMETCEDLRPLTPVSNEPSYNSGGKYGFSDRVIDGMSVVINSVLINFNSPAFEASFQLSRVVLESFSPDWKKRDLRLSRIKDHDGGELLLFKRLEWQVLRIEAKSKVSSSGDIKNEIPITPLRLITSQGCCKMTFKKKLCDCSVIGSRLVFVLDDLLWVLTDSQLVAALHFLQSLSGLVQKATQLTQKQKAKQKLEQQPDRHQHYSRSNQRFSPVFHRHDVIESSFHILCSRIDLHLCDDLDPEDGRSQHPSLKGGGALQVSLHKLIVDYYPYHRAFSSRDHWLHYSEPSSSRSAWIQQLLSLFCDKVQTRSDISVSSDSISFKADSPKHAALYRISSQTSATSRENISSNSPQSPDEKPSLTRKSSGGSTDTPRKNISSRKSSVQLNYRFLMSSCFVLRLEDIVAYKVSTSTASRKTAIEKFLIYNKSAHLPSDIKAIHLEQTSYYLPGDLDYPVPSPNLFLHFGPLKLFLDTPTILWINAFYLNLQKCLLSMKSDEYEAPSLVNIRAEALMPQIVISADKKSPSQPDRPKTLQIQASRIIATNCRVGDFASTSHLRSCLTTFDNDVFNTSKFPWKEDDKKPFSDAFLMHILEGSTDDVQQSSVFSSKEIVSEATNIWSIHMDPFWAEFTVCESGRTRLQSFVDPLPLTLWFYNSSKPQTSPESAVFERFSYLPENQKLSLSDLSSGMCQKVSRPLVNGTEYHECSKSVCSNTSEKEADIYLLIHVYSLLNIQMTHFQYLFVLRAIDSVTEMMDHIEIDTTTILKDKPVLSFCMSAWWPKVEISLVLRSLNQMSATSDSADLASLQEDCSSNSDVVASTKPTLVRPSNSVFADDSSCNIKKVNEIPGYSDFAEDCLIENGVPKYSKGSLPDLSLPKSCSDSLLNCHSSSGSSQASNTPVLETNPMTDFSTESVQKGFHSGTSAMKRGFCSLVASIDSAFAKSDTHTTSLDTDSGQFPDEDTLSIRSDLSSDLDQFVMVNPDSTLEEEFYQHPEIDIPVDVATEAKEDSISNYTLNSEKKKEMISVTTVKLNGLGFSTQSKLATYFMMQCYHIETKEEAAISWENFQNQFSLRARSFKNDKNEIPKSECELSLRVTKEMPEKPGAVPPGFLYMFANNISLQLLMSSVSGLVDFFEDEVVPSPMPAKIIINNLHVQLQEDRLHTGLSPSSVPMNINLPGCVIERTLDGTLSVLPITNGYIKSNLDYLLNNISFQAHSVEDVDSSLGTSNEKKLHVMNNARKSDISACDNVQEDISFTKLLKDNEELRSKLVQMKFLQEENQILRQELNNLQNLVNDDQVARQLIESKNEIQRLKDEKRTLQETLKFLQKEINRLETEKYSESGK